MCGFAGFIDHSGLSDKGILTKMRDCLIHRGPDDSGLECFTSGQTTIGLGFRRLSIQDLSPAGHQPMFSENGRICIILNGEIYNFREIRSELEKLGHHFKSHSDTEVVIHAYQTYGIKFIDHFIGMFSIVLYDQDAGKVFLIRDRAGVKPLYYYHHQDVFLFASEVKAFHQHNKFKKELNEQALALYFQHGYIPAPFSIFNNCFKIKPGHFITYDIVNHTKSETCYWTVDDSYRKPVNSISYEEAKLHTEKLMESAFQYRMVADVPVGVFLSGGYDSTIVASLLQKNNTQKIKTFTIGFKEKEYDESPHARAVAKHLGTEHHELICSVDEAKAIIPMLPEIYDEPFADSSAIPTYLVSKMARESVTVALSADAGDETFAGYTKYAKCLSYLSSLSKLPSFSRKTIASLADVYQGMAKHNNLTIPDRAEKLRLLMRSEGVVNAFNIITQQMTTFEIDKLLQKKSEQLPTAFDEQYGSTTILNQFLWCDYKTYLPDDILCKVDRATMAVSLEGREPLLDHRIIEWSASLPDEFKLKNGNGKVILKDIVHKYVPREIMERPKMGFNIPYEVWFRNELKSWMYDLLNEGNLNHHLFQKGVIKKMLDQFIDDSEIDFQRIWCVINFQLWYNKWMK